MLTNEFFFIQENRLNCLNRLLDNFGRFPHIQTYHELNSLTSQITSLYEIIQPPSDIKLMPKKIIVESIPENRHDKPEVKNLFAKLHKIWQNGLKDYVSLFCIHGSLGSGDYTNYSDCDTFIVISETTLTNRQQLLVLRKYLRKIRQVIKEFDPDQHHGNFLIGEPDLNCYPQSLMPLASLENGWSLGGIKEMSVMLRASHEDSLHKAQAMATRLINLKRLDSGMMLKSNISYVLLLPTLILAAQNQYVYKRESFSICEKRFSPHAWRAVQQASEIRQFWQPVRFWWKIVRFLYKHFPVFALCTENIREKFIRVLALDRIFVKQVLNESYKNWLDDVHFLASECLKQLKSF